MTRKTMTVGTLRVLLLDQFKDLADDDEVTFGGGLLSLHRVKNRGPVTGKQLVDIEFNEIFTVQDEPAAS